MADPLAPTVASTIDARKGVTLLSVLMHAVLCVSAGVGLDAARVIHARYNLQAAADAAALAASRALGDGTRNDVEIRQLAESHFRANVGDERLFGSVGTLSVLTDRDAGRVVVGTDAFLPMTLTRFVGYDDVEIPVAAQSGVGQR
ncbi:pilus assembly protein TadG-related protein [Hyphomicrobium sp.]|uniref:pilus assembly protein TadG-related protein n=1 Tax=Hyphomicrobium sp. TaxID=82 RepID=UPI003F71BFCC